MPLGSKQAPPRGSQLEHRNKGDELQNSSLKLEGVELSYFGMRHLVVNSYQISLHHAYGVKTGPAPRGRKYEHMNNEGKLRIFLLRILKSQSFDIWYVASPSGPTKFIHMTLLGQNLPCLVVRMFGLMIFRTMGRVGSKTKSLDQML